MEKLNVGQQHAVDKIKEFLQSDNKVFALRGTAGTGKSYVINYLAQHYQLNLAGTTNQASRLIGGKTIHNLTGFRIKPIREWNGSLDNRAPILCDEASMMPTYIMKYLMTLPNKIILCGDPLQLVVGNCVDLTAFTGVDLTENMRSKSKALESLVEYLSKCVDTNTMPDLKDYYGEHLVKIENYPQFIDKVNKCGREKLTLAYRNTQVDRLEELTGNAISSHKAQGKSVDEVFVDLSDIYNAYRQQKNRFNNPISLDDMLRLMLVSFSRARHKITFFMGNSRIIK